MSSYAEFLTEANDLSTINDDEEPRYPVAVPHSRRRGTWSEWMKEVVIPPDVLDSIVKRYDSTSWSATGGRSSSVSKDGGVCAKSSAAAWQKKPALSQVPRGETKGGGARAMRGVSGATRAYTRTVGRAQSLRLRSMSFNDDRRPPEERARCPPSRTVLRPGGASRPGEGRRQPQVTANGSPLIPPTANTEPDWQLVGAVPYYSHGLMEVCGRGVENAARRESPKREDIKKNLCREGGREEVNVEVLDYETESDESNFQSTQESPRSEDLDQSSHDEDTAEEETSLPTNGEKAVKLYDGELLSEDSGEEEEEDIVRMKCGCTLDKLDSHSCCTNWEPQSRNQRVCGGRVGPELPSWADIDHTVVLSNIPLNVAEEELEEDILMFGEVTNCAIQSILNEAGLHTAYVRMKEKESCQWVISCYDGMLYGDGALKPMVCYMLPPDLLPS